MCRWPFLFLYYGIVLIVFFGVFSLACSRVCGVRLLWMDAPETIDCVSWPLLAWRDAGHRRGGDPEGSPGYRTGSTAGCTGVATAGDRERNYQDRRWHCRPARLVTEEVVLAPASATEWHIYFFTHVLRVYIFLLRVAVRALVVRVCWCFLYEVNIKYKRMSSEDLRWC